MTANQVYTIVNSAVSQARGASAVTATDTSDLIALGEEMFQSGWQNDFLSAMTDVIGKTIIVNRPYTAQVKGLIKDYFTFGAVLRKIDVEPLTSEADRSWTYSSSTDPDGVGGTNNDYKAGIFVIKKPTVHQTLFNSFNVWSFELTVPDVQLRSAFKSAEEMAAFIDAIMVALQNSITESIDDVARLVYCTYAAILIADTYGYPHDQSAPRKLAINLLAEYNTLFSTSLTAAEALADMEFMQFATKTINLVSKRIQDMGVTFNGLARKRFTPKENQVLTLNSEFVSAYETYLLSPTFHEEMVKLGDYEEVNFWQGSGTQWGDHQKIDITTPAFIMYNASGTADESTAAERTVSAAGVIGILADDRAMGVTVYDRYSAVERDNLKRLGQYKEAANIGYYIDRAENGVVFLVADSNPTVTPARPTP